MRTLVTVLVAVLIVTLVGATAATGWILLRSVPQHTGTLRVAGLDGPVTVRRDANGFVNIDASTSHDLFLAQGYVHASERMWQMEVFRHAGSGRLAELFGSRELDTDRFVRTLGWRRAAEADIAASGKRAKDALGAYAEGVNAWLAANPHLSLPFVLTGLLDGLRGFPDGYRPEPWTPADSVVFAKLEAWALGGNFSTELFRYLVAKKIDATAVGELFVPYPSAHPTIVTESGSAELDRLLAISDQVAGLAGRPDGSAFDPGGLGSNEWAVSGERSSTGFALLANDPHLGVSMPGAWFVNGLHCRPISTECPYDVTGVSFPSVPAIILGHNRHVAWGATNSGPDVEDLFVERVDPTSNDRYEYRGEMRPFSTRTETIKVNGAPDVVLTIRSTVHGPVVDDAVRPLTPKADKGGGLEEPGYVLALQWTALSTEQDLDSILALSTAGDYGGFRAALRDFGGPAQNFLYADDGGHIGFQLAGRIPIRAGDHDGSVPVPGWDGAADWTGFVPFDALPRSLDPPSGTIVTANNAPVGKEYPYFLGREWDAGYRAQRIEDLLAAKKRVSPEDMRTIQLDVQLDRTVAIVAAVSKAAPATDDGKLVRTRVASWDGAATTDSLDAAAGEVLAYRLIRDIFDDELGAGTEKDALARRFVGSQQARAVLIRLLGEVNAGKPASRWWDDTTTPDVVETPKTVIAKALDETGAALREALGDPGQWTWGRLHRMVYREPTLGAIGFPPLDWIFDRGPLAVGGSLDAVDNTVWAPSAAYPDPYDPEVHPADLLGTFETVVAPSYRGVYDTGDWDAARIVASTGQSEHPLDPHFADLIDPWINGELLPLPFSDSAVERAATETLTLQP